MNRARGAYVVTEARKPGRTTMLQLNQVSNTLTAPSKKKNRARAQSASDSDSDYNDWAPSTQQAAESEASSDEDSSPGLNESDACLDGFKRTYHSWEDFDAALAKFSQRTYQIFRKRTSSSFKTRNEQLETRHNAARSHKSHEKIPLLPTQYTTYDKTLLCTHGFERKTKSSGKRKHKFSRFTG
ncbi:hypothetical protein PC110_g22129 [Phytophthora cactorum]|uniref:Uncharacterized protein n=1 Tax=Phytophthora cactorum TaxID=29920 RepID=A0A329RBT6_9STRA|nr:hypothetical protein PC117_g21019 [Phytophthora cactorum]KAG2975249.1 hypothetical protein PC120_g25873 [Phytophthora cactorum]KAG2983319.1 hypothetical protein PC119_g20619 [Phytophthora cactorum]KAG3135478.1 hypothetical protein C6341_g21755 [Phytophthora cactorum]KAG4037955.1 hypothetical protein PC123_g26484 [Phytophthora cactorum]